MSGFELSSDRLRFEVELPRKSHFVEGRRESITVGCDAGAPDRVFCDPDELVPVLEPRAIRSVTVFIRFVTPWAAFRVALSRTPFAA